MRDEYGRTFSAPLLAATRPTTREAFELWVQRNRPAQPLERTEGGTYASASLQAEWLAYAAGWAARGLLP